ncbi:transmembrane protein 218 [Plakobranchus ocellatus]|uniref:Transmembrane protein 218 n=1 Tax=Plakobranchus ocellatus TaxID=259542 RepID=A0AAV3ZIP7_9GAST|nr:transmembrane protein 218 [Plakobranchus ocellatus]
MANLVFGVGIGVFILALVWVLALIVCITFSRSPTKIASLGPLSILVAVLVSVILIVIPREVKEKSPEEESVVYDYSIVYRSSLIAVMALFVVIGLVLYLVSHAMEPVLAKPLRKFVR